MKGSWNRKEIPLMLQGTYKSSKFILICDFSSLQQQKEHKVSGLSFMSISHTFSFSVAPIPSFFLITEQFPKCEDRVPISLPSTQQTVFLTNRCLLSMRLGLNKFSWGVLNTLGHHPTTQVENNRGNPSDWWEESPWERASPVHSIPKSEGSTQELFVRLTNTHQGHGRAPHNCGALWVNAHKAGTN